ncbi:MAG TPA: BamA/TamA family outer membrane protein [Kofleriaceae bacterium]|nr:BamA/TamA family outer membrane protein [Kofleriaceae bacterium]
MAGTTARAGADPQPGPEPERAVVKPPSATASETSTKREPPPVVTPGERETTAADVAGAPVPGDESGRVDEIDPGDSLARRGLRGILFVPKVAVDVALSPLRLSAWAFDRYHLDELYYRVFFNDERTIGLVPTASYESGFGVTAGARFVHRDLFGEREHLSLQAAAGGRYRQVYKAALRSGDRLGSHLAIELAGQYEQRPQDPFWGIGNHDDSMRPAAPVDPRVDPTAVETRYRERIERVATVIDVPLFDDLRLRNSSELTDRTFATSDTGTPIATVYDPAMLVGFDGTRYLYSELELRYDSRRRASIYEPRPFYSMGGLAAVFAGRTYRLDDRTDYWRYGVDLQRFLRLAEGPRVLALRMHGEAVSGSLSDVPFAELPQLGGFEDLRGYSTDRFRDRVAAVGSAEYMWDLSSQVSASVFVDAGRVFPGLGDLALDHMRVGYGVTLQGHTTQAFAVEGSLSSSVDGGVFLNLSFNPVFNLDERVRRR